MHVCLVTYSTRPRGSVVHTVSLAGALARAGVAVTVVAAGRGGDTALFRSPGAGVEVRVVAMPDIEGEGVGERVVRTIAALAPAVEAVGADVVHAQDCIAANAAPGAVRTVHHLDAFTTAQLVECHERALRTPCAHVCVSAGVAAELRAGWGIEAVVIPNGVDAGRFAAAAAPRRTDEGAAARREGWRRRVGGRYVLSVGGVEPRKGSLDLLDAMAALAPDHPDLRLVVAGGETLWDYRDYRAGWEARAAQLAVAPVVLGPVADADLPSLVAGAGAMAFPSLKEGFGLAPMEAAAAGVPVVARDLPVLREVFADVPVWFAGGGAELADGILSALTASPSEARSRAEAGRRLAATYRWEDAAGAHLALYRRLAEAAG